MPGSVAKWHMHMAVMLDQSRAGQLGVQTIQALCLEAASDSCKEYHFLADPEWMRHSYEKSQQESRRNQASSICGPTLTSCTMGMQYPSLCAEQLTCTMTAVWGGGTSTLQLTGLPTVLTWLLVLRAQALLQQQLPADPGHRSTAHSQWAPASREHACTHTLRPQLSHVPDTCCRSQLPGSQWCHCSCSVGPTALQHGTSVDWPPPSICGKQQKGTRKLSAKRAHLRP